MDLGMTAGQRRRQQEKAAREKEAHEQEALLKRASTVTAIAQLMVDQNEKMVAGLRRKAAPASSGEAVDFVARNISNVGPHRSTHSRKETALLARAEVMAAATAHLGDAGAGGGAPRPAPAAMHAGRSKLGQELETSSSAELVRAAAREIERGLDITAFETQTRRPARVARLDRSRGPPALPHTYSSEPGWS
jgi:hypothetical protein